MRLHTDTLTHADLYNAARYAHVDIDYTQQGSRKRKRSFDVSLTGDSPYHRNSGKFGSGHGFAATWDQWGLFFACLFKVDPDMTCRNYDGAEHFHWLTGNRFQGSFTPCPTHKFQYTWPDEALVCRKGCGAIMRHGKPTFPEVIREADSVDDLILAS